MWAIALMFSPLREHLQSLCGFVMAARGVEFLGVAMYMIHSRVPLRMNSTTTLSHRPSRGVVPAGVAVRARPSGCSSLQ